MKIFFIFLFFITDYVHAEKWIKLTCFGPITPKTQISGSQLKMKDIRDYYYAVNDYQILPTISTLRDLDPTRMDQINKNCHELRLSQVDLSHFPTNNVWLDWGTDHLYAGFKMNIEIFNSKLCRVSDQPCTTNQQCCQKKGYSCDQLAKSCQLTQQPDKKLNDDI